MSNSKFSELYREIFADLSLSEDECESFREALQNENPPPDKLPKLRSLAFRIASDEFLEGCDNPMDLLKCLNAITHAMEMTCLVPKESCSDASEDDFEMEPFVDLYTSVFEDKKISFSEGQQVQDFFRSTTVPTSKLVSTRATIFKTAGEFWSEDNVKENQGLLRSVDVLVYYYEEAYLGPKPYRLHAEPSGDTSVESLGVEQSLSQAVQTLYDLDVNRLEVGEDYRINVQEGKKVYWNEDKADEPLFSFVKEHELRSRSTYKTFIALLDNYSSETGRNEEVTDQEVAENWKFIHAIMETAPMQFCHKYLVANAQDVPRGTQEFKQYLYKLWFQMYGRSRGCRSDSSGFEHVFVGEVKDDKISGFHNWIQYYLEEKRGNIDYKGYIMPRCHGDAETDGNDRILTLQFTWHGVEKSVGTSLIGVSPEFEIALYTLCFCMGQEDNPVQLKTGTDVFDLNIKCYRYGNNQIGTSFPEATGHSES